MKKKSKILDRLSKAGWGVAVFAAMFALGFFSASHFMPISESQAEEAGPIYANIATSGEVDLEISSGAGGAAKVGKDTLTVDTNAKNEYKLYISTVKNAAGNGLYLEGDSTKYLTPSNGKNAKPARLATNTWGYTPSRSTSEEQNKSYKDKDADVERGEQIFIGVPEYGDERLLYTNTNPTVAETNSLDVYYGASMSTALPAGLYSNTVVYTAVVDENSATTSKMTITPNSQLGPAAGQRVTIVTDLYPSDTDVSNLGDIEAYIGSGKCGNIVPTINSDGAVQITCNVPKGRNEQDVKVFFRKFDKKQVLSKGYDYDIPPYMSSFSCEDYNIGASFWLNDARDENDGTSKYTYYRFKKLKDGRCWMIDSMELKTNKLTYAVQWTDSDILPGGNFTLANPNDDAWCTDTDSSCYDKSLVTKNGDDGNYYNWYSATAGTGYYSRPSGEAGSSICPTGWRLPTKSEYDNLVAQYGSAAELTSAANLALGGRRNGGNNEEQEVTGYYWSKSSSEIGKAYALKVTSSSAETVSLEGNMGAAIRCIDLKKEMMQEFVPPEGALIGDSKTVFDSRFTGSNVYGLPKPPRYHVAKLADGKWWMLRDLEGIGDWSSVTLTPEDTDITSNFTLPKYDGGAWCTDDTAECVDQIKHAEDWAYSSNRAQGKFESEVFLYNWHTATAGTGTYAMTSGNATSSICPKGWTLPTGGSSTSDFATLSAAYGGPSTDAYSGQETAVKTLMTKPVPAFSNTGAHDKSYGAQSEVLLWSRTARNNTQASYFNLTGGRLFVDGAWGNKYKGFGVRCIRKVDSR